MQLSKLRIERNLDQVFLAEKLGVSIPTLARIEAAERVGGYYRMGARRAKLFIDALSSYLCILVTIDDLENIEVAPPRPGRPPKKRI